MSMKNQHVLPKGKVWEVKGEGNNKATAVVSTQRDNVSISIFCDLILSIMFHSSTKY